MKKKNNKKKQEEEEWRKEEETQGRRNKYQPIGKNGISETETSDYYLVCNFTVNTKVYK